MRQLSKSAISLGWALSLLGAKQVYEFAVGDRPADEDVLSPIAQAAVGELDDSMKQVHRSAINMESYAVDMALFLANPVRWFKPQNWKFWKAKTNVSQARSGAGPASQDQANHGPTCCGDDPCEPQ